jgi:predicted anti-sigma-YlaC factor YlaD
MTTTTPHACEAVRMAALARLDGEPSSLTSDEVDVHLASCHSCQTVVSGLTTLHTDLGRVDYEHVGGDLWPALERRIAGAAGHPNPRERWALAGLAATLVAWRLAQLLLDVPTPVVNSVVPLALTAAVLRWLLGDPFAIQLSGHQLQQKGAS